MAKGYVSLILHSHLPFVRHPDKEDALEERWLFEAMSECYIPLIEVFDNLIKDNIDFKITMSITPPLMSMLEDDYLNDQYLKYLKSSIELTEKEIIRNKDNIELSRLSYFYNERLNRFHKIYKDYDYRLMNAFKKFNSSGNVGIITSSATHALLPLLMVNPDAVRAQIAAAMQSYTKFIGREPEGIWLPECAYAYEIDSILREYGLKYFIAEDKAILNASPRPEYGTYAPIAAPSGVCAFARDAEASEQVWSSVIGYPGDPAYREFYRDIGYELPVDYIGPYINKDGVRTDTGLKYYKITGKTDKKEYYDRQTAMETVQGHASDFIEKRRKQIENVYTHMDKPPVITCPYDTELFGHWWFEGPDFVDNFIRKAAEDNTMELITPSEYLEKYPLVQCSSLSPSSWGNNGDFSVWLNSSNDWIYKYIHRCEQRMIYLADTYKAADGHLKRALNQAARELMLSEASDWPFMIKNNTTAEYAIRRINTHIERFTELYENIVMDNINLNWLESIEKIDNIFPDMDYSIYMRN